MSQAAAANQIQEKVFLVTIKFKKRGLAPNDFTVRLASTEFGETQTVRQLTELGFAKLKSNSLTGGTFLLRMWQRLCGYGRYIGFDADHVLTVYTEKDRGRIAMSDVARHVLVNNETIVVEYYDHKLFMATSFLACSTLLYVGYNVRRYCHYRAVVTAANAVEKAGITAVEKLH